MKLSDSLGTALVAMLVNRMRTILTMLGIIIGTASVVVVVSLGIGGQDYILNQINKIGSNLIWVHWQGLMSSGGSDGADSGNISFEDVEVLSTIPELVAIAPVIMESSTLYYKEKDRPINIFATTSEYQRVRSIKIKRGRFFSPDENTNSAKVCIISPELAKYMFAGAEPIGRDIQLKGLSFTVIGVIDNTDSVGGPESQSEMVYIPITSVKYLRYVDTISLVYAEARDIQSIPVAKAKMVKILEQRHNRVDEYRAMGMDQIQQVATTISTALATIFSLVAAISLVVGGIGVMNIMLVSVTERTREIGIRLAVGARKRDIMSQFLIESVILSVMGGIVGIIIGTLITFGIGFASGYPMRLTPLVIIIPFIISVVIGLVFGLYPANKASKLNPIEALKYE
jgi:putative ABC transport system permease protein